MADVTQTVATHRLFTSELSGVKLTPLLAQLDPTAARADITASTADPTYAR